MKILVETAGARVSIILACLVALALGFAAGAIYAQTVGVRATCPVLLPNKPPWRVPL